MLEVAPEDRRREAGCKNQLAEEKPQGETGGVCAHPEQFWEVRRKAPHKHMLYSSELKIARLKHFIKRYKFKKIPGAAYMSSRDHMQTMLFKAMGDNNY